MTDHPDRRATTLAVRDPAAARAAEGVAGAGSADARIDLKLAEWATLRALRERGTDAARARLEQLDSPELWAGTVRDGVARGFAVALEEARSLCRAESPDDSPEQDGTSFEGKTLRRKKDILVASGGARARWSRRGGLLVVDRGEDVHAPDAVQFEDRADRGTLDAFEPEHGVRPRLFSPAFLEPAFLEQGPAFDRLVLRGRLGRRPGGHPCTLELVGRKDERALLLRVTVDNRHDDHRLRIRFRGLPGPPWITHRCTGVWEDLLVRGRPMLAATLVRACGRLQVGDEVVAVPEAQCRGTVTHEFLLGAAPRSTR